MDLQHIYVYLSSNVGSFGMALLGGLLVLFCIQLYYYVWVYGRIPKYKSGRTSPQRDVEGISVVAVIYHDYNFLESVVPVIMGQDYDNFELVLVDVGSGVDFETELNSLKNIYPNLTTTRFEDAGRFAISNKMALNVGIKAARYPYIVITTTQTRPASERWLALMAKGFSKGDVVLGYCGLERVRGVGNRLMRLTRMMMGADYLSAAIKGDPYRGMLQNMGFSRRLYFESRGFNHLNMNVGEDDLYIGSIATKENTAVVIHPNATTVQYVDGGMKSWRAQRLFLGSTFRYYSGATKLSIVAEPASRLLLFLCVLAAAITLPSEIKIAAGALWLLRLLIVGHTIYRVGGRLGERGFVWIYPLHDLLAPFDRLWLFILRTLKPAQGVWR